MIWEKLKATVELKPFQKDWLQKGEKTSFRQGYKKEKKQILDKLQNDFPLNMDNYIKNIADLPL